MMKEKMNSRKGFTLAELLIVVAIIAVLVAIAIPIFTTRLEQARETTDIANLRSAYAAGQVAALSGDESGNKITSGSKWYDPDNGIGLASSGKALGQGTATDGKANTETLPNLCSYENSKDVRGMGIQITFGDTGVTKVEFASIS